jgi:hypothetical protein
LLLSCGREEPSAQAPPVDYTSMISDSTIIYASDDYHEIMVVYSMPAHLYSTKKRGYIREQLYKNADVLSIDTVKSTIRESPLMRKWQITGRLK